MAGENEKISGSRKQDLVVFMVRRDTQCSECGEELGRGRMLRLEGDKALCLACADLGHLEFLGAGDAAVTRRASKYSRLKAVVVRWSQTRKRYERQGILAESAAIDRAEQESLADADVRARRQACDAERREFEDQNYVTDFARAVREQFPGCPEEEAQQIAQHACRRHSDRIGRTAAAKAFEPSAVRMAVIAHVRHVHTNYDELLSRHGDRESAREEVSGQVAEVLRRMQCEEG